MLVHNAECRIGEILDRINQGKKHPHKNDGSVFENRKTPLPEQPKGFYREYVHESVNIPKPGKERIITGMNGDVWYSPDHYVTFIKIRGS